MIAMAAFYLFATAQVNAERGTEKSRFDIVCDDGVAPEDDLYITTADQVRDVTTSSCMDDSRAKHEQDLAAMGTCFFHLASNLVNSEYLDFFRGDIALHESKRFAFTRTLKWLYANAVVADYHL